MDPGAQDKLGNSWQQESKVQSTVTLFVFYLEMWRFEVYILRKNFFKILKIFPWKHWLLSLHSRILLSVLSSLLQCASGEGTPSTWPRSARPREERRRLLTGGRRPWGTPWRSSQPGAGKELARRSSWRSRSLTGSAKYFLAWFGRQWTVERSWTW